MQRVFMRSTWLMTLLVLMSCVTVNIYFPAAAAEKAADSIIQDVWHEQQSNNAVSSPVKGEPTLSYTVFSPRILVLALLDGLSNTAHAQNVNFSASSPQVEQIKDRMAGRFAKLKPLFESGAVGLTDNGYLAIRDASAAPMALRAQISQLVDAENADRKALYQAIADANNQPGWFKQIQNTFASRWISQAQNGWWYQSGGRWTQK
ncbi:YdbL family protein [Cardiobacteriaceae bacterium TAE3-ERU3]|nr:YdbL family protein [Cardiobacteriaceae bacterium TAE3-ERU3]